MVDAARHVATVQGGFCLVTGVWPLVHLRSFEWLTGPKIDSWLVKTVGALLTVVGAVLLLAARRGRTTPEVAVLGAGCAAGLAMIDVVYVARRRIAPIYLADALVETLFVVAWVVAWRRRSDSVSR